MKEMFYEAIFIPEGEERPPQSIVDTPELSKYIKDWGRPLDVALVAESDDKLVGAIWGRVFAISDAGYGFVDSETPEIGMAVVPEHRNQGIGGDLIELIAQKYYALGVRKLSLSVDKRNKAINLYVRHKFDRFREEPTAWTMIRML